MKQMTAIIEQDEDGLFVAHCPALKGCWSQGETEEEAMANLREAMEGWLEAEEALL
jgi:predicted RNase H-like HicB family nuclease